MPINLPTDITPRPALRNHAMRHVLSAFCSNGWAIDPAKFDEILAFVNLRAAGREYSREDVALAFGESQQPTTQMIGSVAVVPVTGLLAAKANMLLNVSGGSSMQLIAQQFQAALSDPNVSAIVLEIDSPGGTVAGTAELANTIFAARGTKPITAVVAHQATSAAYWIASAADRVVASPSSTTGSIGVLYVQSENSRANAEAGTTVTVFSAGKHKVDGNSYEPLSEQARASIQGRINDMYAAFVTAVARNRSTSAATVEQQYGQGDVMVATRALAAGMVDRIATLEEIVAELAAAAPTTHPTTNKSRSYAGRAAQYQAPPAEATIVNEWEKIRAALAARGFARVEANEADTRHALATFLVARGLAAETDQQALAHLAAHPPAAPAPAPAAAPAAAAAPPAAAPPVLNGEPTGPTGLTAQQGALAERERIRELSARSTLLGIDAATVQAAIDNGTPLQTALIAWTDSLASSHRPVSRPSTSQPEVIGSPLETIVAGSIEALHHRIQASGQHTAQGRQAPGRQAPEPKPLSAAARPFMRMSLQQIAAATIDAKGYRSSQMDPEDVAAAFLGLAPRELTPLAAFNDGSYNAPGLYPNTLSALAGKIMGEAMEFAQATYALWTQRLDDVPDFKPKTIIRLGNSGELPLLEDGKDPTQSSVAEEVSWISVDQYSDDWKMTPRMILNNDLQSWAAMAADKQIAHELTINRLAVNVITGNPTLVDTIALFHASHGNLVASGSGAAPSQTSAATMRQLMRAQKGVGGVRRARFGPAIALVPTTLETNAEQTFEPYGVVPVVDTNINTFRGKVQVAVEPMLDDADTLAWYMFANPALAWTVCHMFQTGYGQGGKTRTYYNPSNNCQVFNIEGRFGVAASNYRGAVKNAGS